MRAASTACRKSSPCDSRKISACRSTSSWSSTDSSTPWPISARARPSACSITGRPIARKSDDGRKQTMTFTRIRLISASVMLLAVTSIAVAPAHAQKFPSKPIHVILPFAVGGLLDATVRAIGQNLSQSVGQPVLVENKPGGGTFIGMEACARAAPDGYTICVTTPDSLVYNPYLYAQVPYDAEKDFAPVTNLVFTNNIIVATRSAPFGTFKEMIAYAKANPGKVTWATWGAGSIPHIYLEAVTRAFNVDILQVPYKGAGQAYP